MKNTTSPAYLVVIDQESGTAAIHVIETETLVGSGDECGLRLEAGDVPRQFMRLMPVGDSLWVRTKTDEHGEIESGLIGLGDCDYRLPFQHPAYIGERFILQRLEPVSTASLDSEMSAG